MDAGANAPIQTGAKRLSFDLTDADGKTSSVAIADYDPSVSGLTIQADVQGDYLATLPDEFRFQVVRQLKAKIDFHNQESARIRESLSMADLLNNSEATKLSADHAMRAQYYNEVRERVVGIYKMRVINTDRHLPPSLSYPPSPELDLNLRNYKLFLDSPKVVGFRKTLGEMLVQYNKSIRILESMSREELEEYERNMPNALANLRSTRDHYMFVLKELTPK